MQLSHMTKASAPGKIILVGEHAVVYGRPAIAVPVTQVQATATVEDAPQGHGCVVDAPDVQRALHLADAPDDDPLAFIVRETLDHLNSSEPDVTITIRSTIPVASGMGSGAAVSTAIVRALAAHLGHPLDDDAVSALVFEAERLYHGTPSGIDNTVIAHGRPLFFVKDRLVESFPVKEPLHLLIANTGVSSPTKSAVGDVRAGWETQRDYYDSLFRQIGQITVMARGAIVAGELHALGALMDGNQWLLQQAGVSSPENERLIQAARRAGALGAKLSGAGRGGNVIALVLEDTQDRVAQALQSADAKSVVATVVN
jgi:mevalonate kinase